MKSSSPTAAIAIATVFANLVNKAAFQLSSDNMLVLEALIRANHQLKDLSVSEIGDYLQEMSDQSMKGLANNVKGIYHELEYVRNENADGDDIYARLFPATNHPGADVILSQDGVDFDEIQLKATDSISLIQTHYVKYPDIPIQVTSELADSSPDITSSGISNEELNSKVSHALDGIEDQSTISQLEDAAVLSGIVSATIHIEKLLSGEEPAKKVTKKMMKDVGAAVTATALVDLLFS